MDIGEELAATVEFPGEQSRQSRWIMFNESPDHNLHHLFGRGKLMFACRGSSHHFPNIPQEANKHMSYRYDQAGKASKGRGGGGRDEMVAELPNGVTEDLLLRSALFKGVPRLGEERIDGNGDR